MFIGKLFKKDPSVKRHLAKTITWRIVGSIDTAILGWIISGKPMIGLKIGGFEMLTKMVLYYLHERAWFRINIGLPNREKNAVKKGIANKDVRIQEFKISRIQRNEQNKHTSFVVWFTGLSGSGKSTLANGLEQMIFKTGAKCYALDGDNVRLGINSDLDFSSVGRKENIRRVAEIAKLMTDAGVIVIASFISPFKEDREIARKIVGKENFVEVFVDCPLDVCEDRDTKGLYKKARQGMIKEFTGISSPYEAPENPDVTIHSDSMTLEDSVMQIFDYVDRKMKIQQLAY